jgi:hypothetical protein
MTAAVPTEAVGMPVEVWFADEARVGQQGTLTRAPRDRRYTWAWLFGAVCPARQTGAAVIMPMPRTRDDKVLSSVASARIAT